jgi:membrane peptidoglycan carboxypeptidase
MLKKLLLLFGVALLLSAGGLAVLYHRLVVVDPGEEIRPENIRRILARETEVYYSDGVTRLGVFFDTAHRRYVDYRDIPPDFINALVAAEDERFFSHPGFDLLGIARATVRNVQARRIVQGGSTLTQQTAKNLFKRSGRSFQEKFKELLYALRLEYHYSKEEIFEFYANQFYVSGNGLGLGVAARYYFDKTPGELSLLECAYIAGSVKQPNAYNPFIKKTDASVELAKKRGKIRLDYVLGKMRDTAMISEKTYRQALGEELVFNQGRVGYALDYAMELVREAVAADELVDTLAAQGIDNIASAGVRIITNVDQNLQHHALARLREELSRLDVRLRGYDRDEVQKELTELDYSGDSLLEEGAFHFGRITRVESEGTVAQVFVDLDKKLGEGVISADGLSRLVAAEVKHRKNLWSEPETGDLAQFLARLHPGDRVWVRVKAVAADAPTVLELERYPLIQGGAIIVKDGKIRGVAGGSDNRFYNRAVHAKRTMGSAFKTVVYAAALQLGWNSADLLNNSRDLFVFHGRPYFPRPDHHSPHSLVSMSWAGTLSENLASVWLLAHLCDHLSSAQFYDVAENLDLTPRIVDGEEEPYRSYRARIRDRFGIVVNREALREAAYRRAVASLETDFIFAGLMAEYQLLLALPYGLNYDRFAGEISRQLDQGGRISQGERAELELRRSLLQRHYLQLERVRQRLSAYREVLVDPGHYLSGSTPTGSQPGRLWHDERSGAFSFWSRLPGDESLQPVDLDQLRRFLVRKSDSEQLRFWEEVRLEDSLLVSAFDRLAAQLDQDYQNLQDRLPYSFEVLAQLEDFRMTVGLHYLLRLTEALGVRSALEPVLSFPLGSNVITLLEATRMYEALLTGQVTTFGGAEEDGPFDALAIIDRIESNDGRLLYRPTPQTRKVVDPKTSLAVAGILENVVKFGTGRSADRNVRFRKEWPGVPAEVAERDLPVPLLGKTGTANNYTNAAFLGYVPGVADNGAGMTLANGYAVGVYVGYDDNQPMRRRSTRIAGSSGALPTWSGIAEAILAEQRYAEKLDPVDLSFYGLRMLWPELAQVQLRADPEQGGKLSMPLSRISPSSRNQPSIITFGEETDGGRFEAERNYIPFWKNPGLAVEVNGGNLTESL